MLASRLRTVRTFTKYTSSTFTVGERFRQHLRFFLYYFLIYLPPALLLHAMCALPMLGAWIVLAVCCFAEQAGCFFRRFLTSDLLTSEEHIHVIVNGCMEKLERPEQGSCTGTWSITCTVKESMAYGLSAHCRHTCTLCSCRISSAFVPCIFWPTIDLPSRTKGTPILLSDTNVASPPREVL